MGDLANDTAVQPCGDGRYQATLSADWEIWGPMGGYVAACALRAAGASTERSRPATFSCHYLGVARFGPVDLRVETRRNGRAATSQRVEVSQEGRPILDAMVWSVGEVEGLEHDETSAPDVPGPDRLRRLQELLSEDVEPRYPFWTNLEAKPLEFEAIWPPDGCTSCTGRTRTGRPARTTRRRRACPRSEPRSGRLRDPPEPGHMRTPRR